jgi:hypothetical protein
MKRIVFITFLLLSVLTNTFAQKHSVQYDTNFFNNDLVFKYPDTLNNSFLRQLKNDYDLLKLTENKLEDIDKVLSVLNWTHNQWSELTITVSSHFKSLFIHFGVV